MGAERVVAVCRQEAYLGFGMFGIVFGGTRWRRSARAVAKEAINSFMSMGLKKRERCIGGFEVGREWINLYLKYTLKWK